MGQLRIIAINITQNSQNREFVFVRQLRMQKTEIQFSLRQAGRKRGRGERWRESGRRKREKEERDWREVENEKYRKEG